MSKNKGKVKSVAQAAIATLVSPTQDAVVQAVTQDTIVVTNPVEKSTADKQNDTIRLANILAMHKLSKPQWEKMSDDEQAKCIAQFDAVPPKPSASIADIGKNSKSGKRGPTGPRTGDAMGAKPLVRKLMGTANEDGTLPAFSVEMLCAATKKSEVNIRTILSDLRSPKYCGAGGTFMTHSFKEGNVTMYRFGDVPSHVPTVAPAAVASVVQPEAAEVLPVHVPSPDGMGAQAVEAAPM